jgi:hypothetical protein
MTRIPLDKPITRRGEPSGLYPMQLEEIICPENPEVPSLHIRSPGTIPTQPEASRMLGGIGAPNPLFDLITIYDDEEIS